MSAPLKTAYYRGTYYRSRLEACWAAFLDAHHIAFEYEKRWVDFGDGVRYLPDFWLPESRAWFEVKGVFSEEDRRKVMALTWSADARGELVLIGGAPAGYAFAQVQKFGPPAFGVAFGRCGSCDGWSYAMGSCLLCDFVDLDRGTYIDEHPAFGACLSRCRDNIAFVWDGSGPARRRIGDVEEQWALESREQLSQFKGNS
jgi:hypothetical protein